MEKQHRQQHLAIGEGFKRDKNKVRFEDSNRRKFVEVRNDIQICIFLLAEKEAQREKGVEEMY